MAAAVAPWGSRSELHPLRNIHWLERTGWILAGARADEREMAESR